LPMSSSFRPHMGNFCGHLVSHGTFRSRDSKSPNVPNADSDVRPSAEVPVQQVGVSSDFEFGEVKVVIGTSSLLKEDSTLVRRISNFSGKGEREVRSRMSYGDSGSERANRVMHVAFLAGVAVGWCSSSTSGWGGDGHWGALSVDVAAQGKGIGSALVASAERRLLNAGCRYVQIEYRFTMGDPDKERLYAWYEGKLGFNGGSKCSGFRCCHKMLSEESYSKQHTRFNVSAQRQASSDKIEDSVKLE